MMPTINTTTPSPKTVFFGVFPNAEKHGLPLLDFFVKKKFRFYNHRGSTSDFFLQKKSEKEYKPIYLLTRYIALYKKEKKKKRKKPKS